MTNEQKLLADICVSYTNASPLKLEEGLDWGAFYELARHHNLIGICHCVFNDNKELDIPSEVRSLFLNGFFDLVYNYTCQSSAIDDIKACLDNAGIRFVFFKGSVLRALYPVAESRAMGDIDLLIDTYERDRAKKELEKIGFECYAPNGSVREYKRDNVLVEVHTRLISEMGDTAFADAFDNAVFNGNEGSFDDSYHFAYLIVHIAHHFRFYGAGIKLLLDLAIMLKGCKIDLERVLEILAPLCLDTFAKEILSLTYELFGVGQAYGKSNKKTLEYFLSCGAFGSLNENKGTKLARENLEQGKSTSPLATKLRLAFPSYEKMKNIPYIKFIEGRPWLVPYAWCYRFAYTVKNRKELVLKTIKDIDDETTTTLAKEELAFFEEIGL